MSQKVPLHGLIFAAATGVAIPILFYGRALLAIAMAVALLALLAGPAPRRLVARAQGLVTTPVGVLLILTFLAWLPNAFHSLEPLNSATTVTRTFALLFLAYLVWYGLQENADLRRICRRFLIASMLITVCFALVSKLGHPGVYWLIRQEPWQDTPMLTELKPVAALAPFLVPLALLVGREDPRSWRWAAWALSAGLMFVIFVAESRSSLAGMLGGAAFIGAALACRARMRNALVVAAGLVVGIVATVIWLKASRHIEASMGEWFFPLWLIDFPRQAIWQFVLEQFARHPWIGLGGNTINLVPGADAVIPAADGLHLVPSHPHNWVVELLAETGVVGFGAYLALVGVTLWTVMRRYLRSGHPGHLAVIAMIGGFLTSGLFNFSFWSSWWQASVLLFGAMALASTASSSESV